MSLYQRGKRWHYDFQYRGERYTGNIGPVSNTVAKEILAKKKAEAVEGRYELPSKKSSPLFEAMAEEYLRYYQANRRPRSVERHQMASRRSSRSLPGTVLLTSARSSLKSTNDCGRRLAAVTSRSTGN